MVRFTTPVTIVTGFLGSGKTTLINRILRESHGERIAVIENEFGEVGVDAEFLATGGDETIIQLANGCVCCTVRGDLARALHELAGRADAGDFHFDRVIIETTGVADPGPVIQTFLAETALLTRYHLDGVVALADCLHAAELLGERAEGRAQIAYADRLLITKADQSDAAAQTSLETQLTELNPRAEVRAVDIHAVPIDVLFALLFETRAHAPDYIPPDELARTYQRAQAASAVAPFGGKARMAAGHLRDVVSCVFQSDEPIDLDCLNAFLDIAQGRYGARLWRCKGLVYARNLRQRLILQGVQGVVQISGGTVWRNYEPRRTTLVFIGQEIEPHWIQEQLRVCLGDTSAAEA